MASTQLEQLRTTFSGLDTAKQKVFIDNLTKKLEGSSNVEYLNFRNECVRRYNAALAGSSNLTVNNYYGSDRVADVYDDMAQPFLLRKKNNAKALIGFILGLVSLLLNFFGIVGILACVFSGIGLGQFNPRTEKNKWMAVTGLVLGIIGVVWGLLGVLALSNYF